MTGSMLRAWDTETAAIMARMDTQNGNKESDNASLEGVALGGDILAVTEEELRRMALDLHDGPVQQLFAAQSQISVMQSRLERGDRIKKAELDQFLRRLAGLAGAALGEIRVFAGSFRPPDFTTRGLVDILRGLIVQHENLTGCRIELTTGDDVPKEVRLDAKIVLYRICQESLWNAYRHSGTTEQRVSIAVINGMIYLRIQDDGAGFRPGRSCEDDSVESEYGLGLVGMRERVRLVGGTLAVQSAPKAGTLVSVEVPLHA